MRSASRISLLLLSMLLAAGDALAGTLDDFEKDTTRHRDSSSSDSSDPDDCGSLASCLLQAFFNGNNDHSGNRGDTTSLAGDGADSEPADPYVLPTLRIDAGYQQDNGDVSASDLRVETGYSVMALQMRQSWFRESSPTDSMRLQEMHALVRLPLGSSVGFALGLGAARLEGNDKNAGLSLTLPVRWRISENVALEAATKQFDFNGSTVQDNELNLSLVVDRFALVAGYRQLRSPGDTLGGPRAGLTFFF